MKTEETTINLEDLMQVDSLMDYLDENKAITFGCYYEEILHYPGLVDKFKDELDKIFYSLEQYKDKLVNIQEAMSPEDTLDQFIEKAIASFESKEDRIIVAILLGMYAADCAKETDE